MYESAEAVCPYYRSHSSKVIRCEGRNKINIKSWTEAEKHIRSVCASHQEWKRCPIAVKLNKKYGV